MAAALTRARWRNPITNTHTRARAHTHHHHHAAVIRVRALSQCQVSACLPLSVSELRRTHTRTLARARACTLTCNPYHAPCPQDASGIGLQGPMAAEYEEPVVIENATGGHEIPRSARGPSLQRGGVSAGGVPAEHLTLRDKRPYIH